MIAYHDEEWGVPVHDDRTLFEFLILEGAQAGLSWNTILNKRDAYRAAYDNFDAGKIARYGEKERARLLADAGIVRNRAKIAASITNAQLVLDVQREFGSLDAYLWRLAGGATKKHAFRSMAAIPATTAESDAMSKELKKRGFKFVGPTICYAFMQAAGLVNDHLTGCYRYDQLR